MEGERIPLKVAAQMTGYHPDYISSLIRRGQIKGEKIGRNWFTTKREVEMYLSTKQYVPASFLFQKKKLVALLVVAVLICFGIYEWQVIGHENPAAIVQNQSDESEPLIVN